MIKIDTACMLRFGETGEELPVVGLEFLGGGAISDITTLEDGKPIHYDALVLADECDIELISCKRLSEDEMDRISREMDEEGPWV